MNTKNVLIGIGVVVLLFLGVTYPKGNPVLNVGASSGPDHYGLEQFLGGFLRGNTLATTTGTAVTLKASDIVGWDTISVTPIVGATTLTFPASSTLRNLVPKAGNMQETCFYNASSTSSITITFVAGTGMDLETATSTAEIAAVPAVLQPLESGCFKFIRKVATASAFDISALYTHFVNAD